MMICLGIDLLLSFVVRCTGESFWSGSPYPLILEHFMELFLLIPPFSLWKQSSSHFQKCAVALVCQWPAPVGGRCGARPSVNPSFPAVWAGQGRALQQWAVLWGADCFFTALLRNPGVFHTSLALTAVHMWPCWVCWLWAKILLLCFLHLLTFNSALWSE